MTSRIGQDAEMQAIGLYAVGRRDICDFIDMVNECNNKVTIDTLHTMLSYDNPEQTKDNKELNALLLPFVDNRKKQMES